MYFYIHYLLSHRAKGLRSPSFAGDVDTGKTLSREMMRRYLFLKSLYTDLVLGASSWMEGVMCNLCDLLPEQRIRSIELYVTVHMNILYETYNSNTHFCLESTLVSRIIYDVHDDA